MKFLPKMKRQPNFLDRVSLGYVINPLNEEDTYGLIKFRLRKAGLQDGHVLFTEKAVKQACIHTQGYPRKITQLCHDALINMLRQEKKIVDDLYKTFIVSNNSLKAEILLRDIDESLTKFTSEVERKNISKET